MQQFDIIGEGTEDIQAAGHDFGGGDFTAKENGLVFQIECNVCGELGENRMCKIKLPHFREVVIMSFTCPECGNKDTEVKSGGEISAQGRLITLNVQGPKDLKRQIYKSETASLEIPEIELHLSNGTLGGVYSTIEGLIEQVLDNLRDRNPFAGDEDSEFNIKMNQLFAKLEMFMEGTVPFTLVIRDLLDNSFLTNPYHPQDDHNAQCVLFDRTEADNDDLGIDTMNTDNY